MKTWHWLALGGVAYLLFAKKSAASTGSSKVPGDVFDKLTPDAQALIQAEMDERDDVEDDIYTRNEI